VSDPPKTGPGRPDQRIRASRLKAEKAQVKVGILFRAAQDRKVLGADLFTLLDHRYAARRPSVRESLLIGLDAELGCSSGELKLGVDAELRVGVAQMCFDGAFAEEQVPGDFRR